MPGQLGRVRRVNRPGVCLGWVLALVCALLGTAQAQLATSFLNVTNIRTKVLPNAVQVRIETDGTVQFGGDQRDWIDFDVGFVPKAIQSLRIRIVRARAKLPAFVPIETYPIDGASISLGRAEFQDPYFSDRGWDQGEPRVDVEFRFAAPIVVRKFAPEFNRAISFGDYLGPREASVELAQDRRAIVLTVITDRADSLGAKRLDRSPLAGRKSTLEVSTEAGALRINALHTPLNQFLDAVGRQSGVNFLVRPEAALTDITLNLPATNTEEILHLLERGYGLGSQTDGLGRIVVGRGGNLFQSRQIPLYNLSPTAARLLFPDFLLPYLRSDEEHNSLLAFGPPLLVERLARDVKKLDTLRPQFRIEAVVWDITNRQDYMRVLDILRTGNDTRVGLGTDDGQFAVALGPGMQRAFNSTLQMLKRRGVARLTVAPSVTAISGARGTVFLGQTRFIKVLRQQGSSQIAQALGLKIGYELNVTPRGGDNGPVLLEVAPRASTVDDVEVGSGLPTLGIREINTTVRVLPGEAVLLAGLDSDLAFDTKDKSLPARMLGIGSARRNSADKTSLLVLLSVQRIDGA